MALLFGMILLFTYSWMWPSLLLPNERSRVYLTLALVDDGTVAIDEAMRRYGKVGDRASFGGRTLTDKAPGSSLLAAVPYAVVRLFTAPEDWSINGLIELMRLTVMLPIGILGFLAMRRTLLLVFDDPDLADLGGAGWLLATTAFHYTSAFYGHQIVAVMLLVALWQILEAERADDRWWRYALAGGCAGLAGLTEYQAGVPCLMLTAWVMLSPGRSVRRLAAFGLAAVPSVVILLAYNQAAFGGPFELSYNHLALPQFVAYHDKGIGGVALPNLNRLPPVLASLHRGLLTTSPIFLMVLPGVFLLWRRGERRLSALSVGVSLYFLFIITGARAWFGGWSYGLRLMVPAFPWLIIAAMAPMGLLRERAMPELLTRAVFVVGLLQQQVIHAILPEIPLRAMNPLVDIVLPSLQQRIFVPNRVVELTGVDDALWTLIPLAALTVAWALWMSTPRGGWMASAGRQRWLHRLIGYGVSVAALVTMLMIVHARGRTMSDTSHVKTFEHLSKERTKTRRMRGPQSAD